MDKKQMKVTGELKKFEAVVVTVLVLVVVLVIAKYLWQGVSEYLDILRKQNRAEMVQGCMEISSYTYDNRLGVVTVEPIEEAVKKCLELKGY